MIMLRRWIDRLRGRGEEQTGTGTGTGTGDDSEDGEEDGDDVRDPDSVVDVAITDELDLHTFAAREAGDLVSEYLEAARTEGLAIVRIIHGKGRGILRRRVHAVLDRHPAVASHRPGGDREGGWGATVVTLRPPIGPSRTPGQP